MKIGSLFSGGGLGDFGFLAAGFEIAWQVEIDDYCQKILALRYPESKKYHDIKTIKGQDLDPVDIITGGFPCQPFSNAGSKMGKSDDRHLWPEMFRIIQEVKPSWVVGENVSGFVDMALDDVCANLESAGYEVGTIIFPAHALGALHRRERVWIVANSRHGSGRSERTSQAGQKNQKERSCDNGSPCGPSEQSKDVADTELRRCVHGQVKEQPAEGRLDAQCESFSSCQNVSDTFKHGRKRGSAESNQEDSCRSYTKTSGYSAWSRFWQSEPAVGRVVDGCPKRVDRLKVLGNGQVPACTYVLGRMIMEIEGN